MGVLMQITVFEGVLVLKQIFVHRPELALCLGRLGSRRRAASMRVNLF